MPGPTTGLGFRVRLFGATPDPHPGSNILTEDGDNILLEDGTDAFLTE